jgi:hypothetical protein
LVRPCRSVRINLLGMDVLYRLLMSGMLLMLMSGMLL